jgi:hypothetical protein
LETLLVCGLAKQKNRKSKEKIARTKRKKEGKEESILRRTVPRSCMGYTKEVREEETLAHTGTPISSSPTIDMARV